MRVGMASVVVAFVALATAFPANAQEPGREAFVSNNCNRCHAIASQEVELTAKRALGPDLGKIGESRDAEWIAKYIQKEVQANDKNHTIAWKGSDEELQAIASWLASLK